MDPKANFDVFSDKLANYKMQTFNNPGDVVYVVRDIDYPRSSSENKHIPKDLNEDKKVHGTE